MLGVMGSPDIALLGSLGRELEDSPVPRMEKTIQNQEWTILPAVK